MWLFKPKNVEISDRSLLAKYKETGDLIHLEDLYNRYIHVVYGTCLKYLAQRERSQDAVMDIFEKLVVKLKSHDVKIFKSWLYVFTRNHCLMILRKDSGVREEPLDLFSQNLPEQTMDLGVEFHPFDIDKNIEKQEEQLRDCIARLKTKQRECIQLFYFDGMSYHSIAKQLSMPKEKVKSHIQNGKLNLKNCMLRKNGSRKEK